MLGLTLKPLRRCRNTWFCNRECQVVSRKQLGHRGANCCPADGVKVHPKKTQ